MTTFLLWYSVKKIIVFRPSALLPTRLRLVLSSHVFGTYFQRLSWFSFYTTLQTGHITTRVIHVGYPLKGSQRPRKFCQLMHRNDPHISRFSHWPFPNSGKEISQVLMTVSLCSWYKHCHQGVWGNPGHTPKRPRKSSQIGARSRKGSRQLTQRLPGSPPGQCPRLPIHTGIRTIRKKTALFLSSSLLCYCFVLPDWSNYAEQNSSLISWQLSTTSCSIMEDTVNQTIRERWQLWQSLQKRRKINRECGELVFLYVIFLLSAIKGEVSDP